MGMLTRMLIIVPVLFYLSRKQKGYCIMQGGGVGKNNDTLGSSLLVCAMPLKP
jgi:hypothetical protein